MRIVEETIQVRCQNCNKLIEATGDEIITNHWNYAEGERGFICPNCNAWIKVENG